MCSLVFSLSRCCFSKVVCFRRLFSSLSLPRHLFFNVFFRIDRFSLFLVSTACIFFDGTFFHLELVLSRHCSLKKSCLDILFPCDTMPYHTMPYLLPTRRQSSTHNPHQSSEGRRQTRSEAIGSYICIKPSTSGRREGG